MLWNTIAIGIVQPTPYVIEHCCFGTVNITPHVFGALLPLAQSLSYPVLWITVAIGPVPSTPSVMEHCSQRASPFHTKCYGVLLPSAQSISHHVLWNTVDLPLAAWWAPRSSTRNSPMDSDQYSSAPASRQPQR